MAITRPLVYWLKTVCCALTLLAQSSYAAQNHHQGRTTYYAAHAAQAPTVDGVGDETVWQSAQWQSLDQTWLGPEYSADDFQGRYKVVWTGAKLYLLAEIVDDVLVDSHSDPLTQYWDDDCLEIFLDEDFSGGDHQFNHNAFAYHISLDNQAIDMSTSKTPKAYNHHIQSRWQRQGDKLIWELSLDVYSDAYQDLAENNQPETLYAGKVIGMMAAYCDNDGSPMRENFIGSELVPGQDKNRGWKDAGLFGKLILSK